MTDFDRNDPRSEHARTFADRQGAWQCCGTVGVGAIIGILAGWEAGLLSAVIAWIVAEIGIQIWENHRYL
jgi:uncharacterized membrane protein (Fun14 family)